MRLVDFDHPFTPLLIYSSAMSASYRISMQLRTLVAAGHFRSCVATARSASGRFPLGILM